MSLAKIEEPIVKAIFLERLNRFTALVRLHGENVNANLRDSGRLSELLIPEREMLLIDRGKSPKRKTRYEVLAIKHFGEWVLINTRLHSEIASNLIKIGLIPLLSGCEIAEKEVKINHSRIDFMLRCNGNNVLLEVKGCTLARGNIGLFPDAPTERGRRHVETLIKLMNKGVFAAILFIVPIQRVEIVAINYETDSLLYESMRKAWLKGVYVTAYKIKLVNGRILPVELAPFTPSRNPSKLVPTVKAAKAVLKRLSKSFSLVGIDKHSLRVVADERLLNKLEQENIPFRIIFKVQDASLLQVRLEDLFMPKFFKASSSSFSSSS